MKKRIATVIFIMGILLFGVEMIFRPLKGSWGNILTVISILMIIIGLIVLCLLNRHRREETAETIEISFNLIEMILDFFIG